MRDDDKKIAILIAPQGTEELEFTKPKAVVNETTYAKVPPAPLITG